MDVQDTKASISRILEELLPSADQAGAGIPPHSQAAYTDIDPS